METLKAIYEAFGTPYPRGSLILGMVLSAAAFAVLWLFLAKQVEKGRVPSAPSQVSGPATAGKDSVANTGNGNTINQSSPTEKAPKKE
jgi:hypothetical protein